MHRNIEFINVSAIIYCNAAVLFLQRTIDLVLEIAFHQFMIKYKASRLLLVDDHPLFREGLVQAVIRAQPEARIVNANGLSDVNNLAKAHENFDLVALDLSLPGGSPLNIIETVEDRLPRCSHSHHDRDRRQHVGPTGP